ncbi:BZ3500_MvSof-1268-A1-R1_Chr6-3g08851 [Microbotryum saponariae]|uniref:BZ3500_MvSof-1268-A1-R1_Chr6-3g08851 protein n=1 Tax=Microbotryum saponariae TaxID=289078 RepID=A0A2X0MMZ1_9BASI|nr:BZ3500_MvSof-1268-A1-R1_Chr6-3g08851 [Microbotryum saponariae]SDA07452.1 BZ3501_MvSof-1269-A2-R1_Chr6-2g08554 [Microbotryum saponariae]
MHHASGHVPPSVQFTKQALKGRRAACTTMYSYPSSASSVPVLEDVVFRWDSTCYNFTKIDLYLSVQSLADGLVPVHCWTQIDFGMGTTKVRLNPTWWNASSNGGDPITAEVSLVTEMSCARLTAGNQCRNLNRQLGMTASGSPLWNTPASSSPAFTITNIYNASNTNAPATEAAANGSPTVGISHSKSLDGGLAGGRLAAAVATPLVALMVAVCAYLAWHKFYRKRGDTKRWSAVIDKRVSMMSEGTWQPSASIVSRPESFRSRNRHSTSSYGNLEGAQRGSIIRPSSTYSSEHASPPRRPVDRSSRISFASIPELSRREGYDKLPGQSHRHGRTRSDMGPQCTRRDLTQMSSSPSDGALNPRLTGMSAYKSSLRHEVLLSDPIKVELCEEDVLPSGPVRPPGEDPAYSISSESDDSFNRLDTGTNRQACLILGETPANAVDP